MRMSNPFVALFKSVRRLWAIDPALEATRLMSINPMRALNRLQNWWATNQPDARALSVDFVGHVERYMVDNRAIYVIFDGRKGKQEGGMCLVDSNGCLVPIFQGNNFLSGDDQFIDLNGDGIPEILAVKIMGGKRPNNPNRVVTDTTCIDIIPISRQQTPLLRILFDKRKFGEPPTWHWSLKFLEDGRSAITLSNSTSDVPFVEFVWHPAIGAFHCPCGSISAGYIARAGDIPLQLIEEFVRPTD